jgi:hypothetical protein
MLQGCGNPDFSDEPFGAHHGREFWTKHLDRVAVGEPPFQAVQCIGHGNPICGNDSLDTA